MLRYECLGRTSITGPSGESVIKSHRIATTLNLLLLAAQREYCQTDWIICELWPEEHETLRTARATVQTYVSAIRKHIAAADGSLDAFRVLETNGPTYMIHLETRDSFDVNVVRDRLNAARLAKKREQWESVIENIQGAYSAYKGTIVTGRSPFLAMQTNALLAILRETRELEVEAMVKLGNFGGAVCRAWEMLAEDNLRERLYVLLMMAQSRMGDRAAAMETFHRARAVLREELGIDAGPELANAYKKLLNGVPI